MRVENFKVEGLQPPHPIDVFDVDEVDTHSEKSTGHLVRVDGYSVPNVGEVIALRTEVPGGDHPILRVYEVVGRTWVAYLGDGSGAMKPVLGVQVHVQRKTPGHTPATPVKGSEEIEEEEMKEIKG